LPSFALSLSILFLEEYEYARHVVAADTLSLLDVLSDRLEQQVAHDPTNVDTGRIISTLPVLCLERRIHPFDHLFVRFLLPDAIAAHYYEINFIRDVELIGVRISSNRLLLGLQVLSVFIFEVTN
jgi:hypothetical protein